METGTNFLTHIVIFITLKQLVHIIKKIHFKECILECLYLEIELRTSQPIQKQKPPIYIVKQFIVRCPLIFSLVTIGENIPFLDVIIHKIKLRNSKLFLKYVQRNRKTNSCLHIYYRNFCSRHYQSQGFFAMPLIHSIFLKIILQEYSFTLNTCLV